MGRLLKRVPLDFSWPYGERDPVWEGYIMPDSLREETCVACDGRGESPFAKRLNDLWWGYERFDPTEVGLELFTVETPEVRAFAERNQRNAPEFYGNGESAVIREAQRLANLWNGMWQHHLTQAEVDHVLAHDMVYDLTHTFVKGEGWVRRDPVPTYTAEEYNRWTLTAMTSPGQYVLAKMWCALADEPYECQSCHGHGTHEKYEGQRAEAEAWEPIEPPEGDGYQLWENTTEGSPISPVFETIEELCRYAAYNCSVFGDSRVSADEWREMLDEGFVRHEVTTADGTKLTFI